MNDRGTGTRKDDAPGKVAAEPRQAVRGGAERLENPNGCLRTIGKGVHTQHPAFPTRLLLVLSAACHLLFFRLRFRLASQPIEAVVVFYAVVHY